jgi:hypothetical protein
MGVMLSFYYVYMFHGTKLGISFHFSYAFIGID